MFARFENIVDFSNQLIENRIRNHLRFVQERTKLKGGLGYESVTYGFPVMTSQEVEITFDEPLKILRKKSEINIEYREKPTFKYVKGALVQKGKSLGDWITSGLEIVLYPDSIFQFLIVNHFDINVFMQHVLGFVGDWLD